MVNRETLVRFHEGEATAGFPSHSAWPQIHWLRLAGFPLRKENAAWPRASYTIWVWTGHCNKDSGRQPPGMGPVASTPGWAGWTGLPWGSKTGGARGWVFEDAAGDTQGTDSETARAEIPVGPIASAKTDPVSSRASSGCLRAPLMLRSRGE